MGSFKAIPEQDWWNNIFMVAWKTGNRFSVFKTAVIEAFRMSMKFKLEVGYWKESGDGDHEFSD